MASRLIFFALPLYIIIANASVSAPLNDAQSSAVIDSMDELRFHAPAAKAKAELVAGRTGKAVKFSFEEGRSGVFCTSNIHGTSDWDNAAGFSFWVKGDGSDHFGGLEFIYDEDYAVRYDYVFPLKGTDWTRVVVAWSDLIPVLPGPRAKSLGVPGGNQPSKLSALWFGRWWYWADYPAEAFTIDDIRLAPEIPREQHDYRPTGPPLARVLKRLRAHQPVTIVTTGDSLTDTRHWSNRQSS